MYIYIYMLTNWIYCEINYFFRATSCTANVSPTSPVSPTSTVINNYDGAQSENSGTSVLLITAAVSVPMGLLLLILVTVVVALLVYVWIVKKRAQIIVTNSLEPEPYGKLCCEHTLNTHSLDIQYCVHLYTYYTQHTAYMTLYISQSLMICMLCCCRYIDFIIMIMYRRTLIPYYT